MDKLQAYHSFWSGFGLPAYEVTSVPDNATMPYITYESSSDDFGNTLALSASVWYWSSSWADCISKVKEISTKIGRGGKLVKYDGGAFWIKKGTPWANRLNMNDNDSVRRINMNIELEFID